MQLAMWMLVPLIDSRLLPAGYLNTRDSSSPRIHVILLAITLKPLTIDIQLHCMEPHKYRSAIMSSHEA